MAFQHKGKIRRRSLNLKLPTKAVTGSELPSPLKPALAVQPFVVALKQFQKIGRILASAERNGAFENDPELHIVVSDFLLSIRARRTSTVDRLNVCAAKQTSERCEGSSSESIASDHSDEQAAHILAGTPEAIETRVKQISSALLAEYRNSTMAGGVNHVLASDRADSHTDDAVYNIRVVRAEAWIDTHLTEALSVEDVASAFGISTRTLRLAFRRVRGCSPLRAIIFRRLDRVRAALAAAAPGTTVTDIATGCGFFELGRFAVRYRQRFGEKPSETLARNLRQTTTVQL
jgi:AraC-like DNA-binding protein